MSWNDDFEITLIVDSEKLDSTSLQEVNNLHEGNEVFVHSFVKFKIHNRFYGTIATHLGMKRQDVKDILDKKQISELGFKEFISTDPTKKIINALQSIRSDLSESSIIEGIQNFEQRKKLYRVDSTNIGVIFNSTKLFLKMTINKKADFSGTKFSKEFCEFIDGKRDLKCKISSVQKLKSNDEPIVIKLEVLPDKLPVLMSNTIGSMVGDMVIEGKCFLKKVTENTRIVIGNRTCTVDDWNLIHETIKDIEIEKKNKQLFMLLENFTRKIKSNEEKKSLLLIDLKYNLARGVISIQLYHKLKKIIENKDLFAFLAFAISCRYKEDDV